MRLLLLPISRICFGPGANEVVECACLRPFSTNNGMCALISTIIPYIVVPGRHQNICGLLLAVVAAIIVIIIIA